MEMKWSDIWKLKNKTWLSPHNASWSLRQSTHHTTADREPQLEPLSVRVSQQHTSPAWGSKVSFGFGHMIIGNMWNNKRQRKSKTNSPLQQKGCGSQVQNCPDTPSLDTPSPDSSYSWSANVLSSLRGIGLWEGRGLATFKAESMQAVAIVSVAWVGRVAIASACLVAGFHYTVCNNAGHSPAGRHFVWMMANPARTNTRLITDACTVAVQHAWIDTHTRIL